jgi:hypothetical protein
MLRSSYQGAGRVSSWDLFPVPLGLVLLSLLDICEKDEGYVS